ncbi:MAG: Xaa-Pro peptidase family protein [Planctomycetota bacterium]
MNQKISNYSFSYRIKKASQLLKKHKYDALFLTPGTNLYYLTGLSIGMLERLILFILFPDGNSFLIGPAFEIDRLNQNALKLKLQLWKEQENPYKTAAKLLQSKIRKSRTVALEPTCNFRTYNLLFKEIPDYRFENASIILDSMRIAKSQEEVTAISRAASKTLKRIDFVKKFAKPGITELELLDKFGGKAMVQFGPTSAIPHASSGKRKLRKNDVIIIDASDTYDHYLSDITRTLFVGKPSNKAIDIFNIVKAAQEEAIKKITPGISFQEIDSATHSVIEKAGYGKFFTHRTGHGLGLDIHEQPLLMLGNSNILSAGAVVTIEPGIYLPGEFGVRLEDDVLVTENGYKLLSKCVHKPTIL